MTKKIIDWWLSIYKEGKSRPASYIERTKEYNAPVGKRLKATVLIFITAIIAVSTFLCILGLLIYLLGPAGFFLMLGTGIALFFIYSCVLDKY